MNFDAFGGLQRAIALFPADTQFRNSFVIE